MNKWSFTYHGSTEDSVVKIETKENSKVTISLETNNNITQIMPDCDCMTVFKYDDNSFEVSFVAKPVPNDKQDYETIKLLFILMEDGSTEIFKIHCKITR